MFFYLLYIVLEFSFNAKLLLMSSSFTINNVVDFKSIEFMGKSLSSIGIGAFSYTLISSLLKTRKSKRISVIASVLIASLFFIYQESFINRAIESTGSLFREDAESSLILKTGILNGSINSADYNIPESVGAQNRAFVSSIGLLTQGFSSTFDDFKRNKDNIYPVVFKREILDNQDSLYPKYLKYNIMTKNMWDDYKNLFDGVKYIHEDAMSKIKYNVIYAELSLLHNSHSRYASYFNDGKRTRMQVAGDLSRYYMDLAGCEDYSCVRSGRGHRFFKMHIDKVISGRQDLYSDFMGNCEFKTTNSKAFGRVYIDGRLHLERPSSISGRNNDYTCNINSRDLYSLYNSNYERIAFEKYGIRSLKRFGTLNEFSNTPDIKKLIFANSSKYGLDFNGVNPDDFNIDYSSEVKFSRSVFSIIEKSIANEFNNEMTAKYGVSIPVGLKDINSFFKSDGFNKILLSESGGLIDSYDWKLDMNKSDFEKSSILNLPDKFTSYFSDRDLMNNYGEAITKAVILPPILITLSLFFGLLNLINFLFIILDSKLRNYFDLKYIYMIKIVVYVLFFLAPFLMNFGIFEDPNMNSIISEVRSESYLFYCVFKWVLGVYYFI